MNDEIVAGIVLYNPNIDRLKENIKSISKQVKKIIIVDNSSENKQLMNSIFLKNTELIYIQNEYNVGLGKALNQILNEAKKLHYNWVITLDQDSICPLNLLDEYSKYLGQDEIGIICPSVIDERRKYMKITERKKLSWVDMCITSASCTNIKAWEKVGKFDEKLFIDLIDNEFCKRIRINGFKILKLNNLILNQEFGEIKEKDTLLSNIFVKLSEVLKNDNIGRLSYKKKVNPLRVYYTCRNIIYVNKKLKNYGKTAYKQNYNCNSYLGFIVCFIIPSILRADKKITVIKSVFLGTLHGRKMAKETIPLTIN